MAAATDEELRELFGDAPIPEPPAPPQKLTGRELLKLSRSYPIRGPGNRVRNPGTMRRLCDFYAQTPVISHACKHVGISVTTLKYWLTCSSHGAPGDGYDIPDLDGEEGDTIRFHEAWTAAEEMGLGSVEMAAFNRARGYQEPLTFQGRVKYQVNPDLMALGFTEWEAMIRDPVTGQPIPETITKQDPDMIQYILSTRSDKYKKKQEVDVNMRGGVLVVGMKAATSAALDENERQMLSEPMDVEFEEVDDDADGA